MITEISIFNNPVAAPGVCAKCGSQDKEWFVDLGFEQEMHKFEHSLDIPIWLDGVVYLCCDCINDLVTVVTRKFEVFKQDHYVEVGFNGISGSAADSIFDGSEQDSDGNESESVESSAEVASAPTFFGVA